MMKSDAERFLIENNCANLVLTNTGKQPYKYASDLIVAYAKERETELGRLIQYPDKWDVEAHPTLSSALYKIGQLEEEDYGW